MVGQSRETALTDWLLELSESEESKRAGESAEPVTLFRSKDEDNEQAEQAEQADGGQTMPLEKCGCGDDSEVRKVMGLEDTTRTIGGVAEP